jgi:hypothetical protein
MEIQDAILVVSICAAFILIGCWVVAVIRNFISKYWGK